jgi:hypothetical protein
MTGRLYPELWAKLAALITFVGFNLTFFHNSFDTGRGLHSARDLSALLAPVQPRCRAQSGGGLECHTSSLPLHTISTKHLCVW